MISKLYVENGVGKDVMRTIDLFKAKHGIEVQWQHDVHPQMQRKQRGDEWWIEDIAKKQMAVLTQDASLLGIAEAAAGYVTSERQAVIDHKAHVVALGNAQYTTWDKLRCVLNHWGAIDAMLREDGPQGIVIYLSKLEIVQF